VSPGSGPADLAVVGAGVIGLATAHAAAERGARVVVVERDRPGGAQSAGPGRIFRHAHETIELVALAARARQAWRAAEERLGIPLLGAEGALLVGDPGPHAQRLAAAGVEHEVLDGAGVLAAMPALGPWPAAGLLDPGGGAIDAEGYLGALATKLAGSIVAGRLHAIRRDGEGLRLAGDSGELDAGRVLVAAGAGAPALAQGLGLTLPVALSVHHRVAFAPIRAGRGPGWPCLLERSELMGPRCYGLALPDGSYAIGVGAFDDLPEAESVARTAAHVARAFPGIGTEPSAVVRCEPTTLAGHPEHFGLYATDLPGAAVFCGGNLFKFAAILGPLLAEAMLEGRYDPVLEPPGAPAS